MIWIFVMFTLQGILFAQRGLDGHVARIEEIRNAYRFWLEHLNRSYHGRSGQMR